MRNLYRPICLMALLAVAPAVLIGCSGGSSSNNSSSNSTRATVNYTTLDGQPFLEPLDVRGVFKSSIDASGLPDFSKGNGTFSYRFTSQIFDSQQLANAVVINSSSETRTLFIFRPTTTGQDGPVGTVYNYSSNSDLTVILFRRFKSDDAPFGAEYDIISGSATVTANDGDNVTLQLNNVVLRAITNDTPEPRDIRVSGSVTYNRKNIKTIASGNANDAIPQSLKR